MINKKNIPYVIGAATLIAVGLQIPNLVEKIQAYNEAKEKVHCTEIRNTINETKRHQDKLRASYKDSYYIWQGNHNLSAAHWEGGPLPGTFETKEIERTNELIKNLYELYKKECLCK